MTGAHVVDSGTKTEPRRESRGGLVLFASIAFFTTLAGCGGASTTPEAQLRAWVDAVESAAENKDRSAILDLISEAYTDSRGNSRDSAGNMLRLYFLRQNRILLATKIGDIVVAADTAADMTVTVGMAGTSDRTLGISADAYRFELELEAEDFPESFRDWKLISARWAELGSAPR